LIVIPTGAIKAWPENLHSAYYLIMIPIGAIKAAAAFYNNLYVGYLLDDDMLINLKP
jgi:hypothetical protein